jgi:flagellar motor switch protein FliG
MATGSYDALTGPEKASILMLSLSEEHAARLFSMLEIEEVMELSQTMSLLGRVDAELVERLLREFGERLSSPGGVVGGFDTTEKLLLRFLDPTRVDNIMEEIRGPAGRTVWDKLGNVNETVLASYLKNEYPQTVAVVLSRLEAAHAARVLSTLPEDFAVEVVQRMLRMEVVQKDILADVERTLRAEFMSNLARTNRRDNHEVMAEIFTYFDRSTESRFMSSLEERNKEAADRIKALMFTFEDLAKLDGSGMQVLLRSAGNDRVAVALKGASERLKDLVFANMSERGAKIMREDMQGMGPVRLRDVEEAQLLLVNLAKELAASGEIFLADGKRPARLLAAVDHAQLVENVERPFAERGQRGTRVRAARGEAAFLWPICRRAARRPPPTSGARPPRAAAPCSRRRRWRRSAASAADAARRGRRGASPRRTRERTPRGGVEARGARFAS